MQAPLALGVVGAGSIARDYLAVLASLDLFRVAGVADVDPTARDVAREMTGVPVFDCVATMLDELTLDAALVLTPPVTHEPVTIELLQCGVHVLCEKPISVSSVSAECMFRAAKRAHRTLMMASKFRYVPDVVEAQRIVAGGEIGDVILFDNAFCSRVELAGRWNADREIAGGGVLIDNGCHSVDVARCFLGTLIRVFAHFGRRTLPIQVEDTVRIMVEAGCAAVGHIDLSWAVDKGDDYYVALQGTRGTVQIGWRGSRYRLEGERDWRPFGSGYDKRVAFEGQLRNFAGVVNGEESPVVTVTDALESVRAIEAAYRSARVGRWVPLHGYDGMF